MQSIFQIWKIIQWRCFSGILLGLENYEENIIFLSFSFPDHIVRTVAVSWIKSIGSDELIDLLPQLVQSVKHEMLGWSPCAHFLLERALSSPRLAHSLYWCLQQCIPTKNHAAVSNINHPGCIQTAWEYHLEIVTKSVI